MEWLDLELYRYMVLLFCDGICVVCCFVFTEAAADDLENRSQTGVVGGKRILLAMAYFSQTSVCRLSLWWVAVACLLLRTLVFVFFIPGLMLLGLAVLALCRVAAAAALDDDAVDLARFLLSLASRSGSSSVCLAIGISTAEASWYCRPLGVERTGPFRWVSLSWAGISEPH